MLIDIVDISQEELDGLSGEQMKLYRAAQEKKNEIVLKSEKELQQFKNKVLAAGMKNSELYNYKKKAVTAEVNRKIEQLVDNLIFDLSLIKVPPDSPDDDDSEAPYLVDYSLSYSERYIIVRDYYLTIKDVDERMRRYAADEVAKKYLDSYYKTLYNTLATYEK